jgi:hypothetical protein
MPFPHLRPDGAGRQVKDPADLIARKAHVVVQDDDGTLLERQLAERSLELIALSECPLHVIDMWVVIRDDPKPSLPASDAPNLGAAGVDQEREQPRFESLWVAQARKLAPGDQERLLDGVLCSCRVAQDPIRDGVEPIAKAMDKRGERLLVLSLRAFDELDVHGPSRLSLAPWIGRVC